MSNRLLPASAVIEKLGRKSKRTIYDLMKRDPRFPHPVKLPGRGASGEPVWADDELDAYIEALKAERDQAVAQ